MLDTYTSDHAIVYVDIDLPKPTVNKVTFFIAQLLKFILQS